MPNQSFAHVDTWVFDLDHTLYPPKMQLFDQIEARMVGYMTRELGLSNAKANLLRRSYWETYGTTLAGLMREHDVAPDPFLDEVHDISFDVLTPDPDLAARISDLPGRRIVYTNGHKPYALEVLSARGLTGLFDAVYGIEHASYCPKPEKAAFDQVFRLDGLNPKSAAMFEDDPRNLKVPHALGLQTVHVAPTPEPLDHVHHHTDDLSAFLSSLKG